MQFQNIYEFLQFQLSKDVTQIGQLEFTADFQVFHHKDAGCADLHEYEGPNAAREIVRYDDAGRYRPLKTAPNLRRGWKLKLNSIEELHLALDFFYPAALGLWFNFIQNQLNITHLRNTLGRQSGMYRIASRITDVEAQDLVQNFCRKGCLRNILWELEHSTKNEADFGNRKIPLLCSEACHLFISEARRVVKNK